MDHLSDLMVSLMGFIVVYVFYGFYCCLRVLWVSLFIMCCMVFMGFIVYYVLYGFLSVIISWLIIITNLSMIMSIASYHY